MKKSSGILLLLAVFLLASCTMGALDEAATPAAADMTAMPADIDAWEARVNADFATVLASVGTDGAAKTFADYDARYGTSLSSDFSREIAERLSSSGTSSYPALTDLPFRKDGAVYLSGGATDIVGGVIGWVAPKNFPGGYYHGAALDLNKYDPNNADAPCLQTAITKGAGYESANDWRNKVNVCVLNPNFTVNATSLNTAQAAMDYYCKASNTNMEYGFFKNYVNIFNVVTKSDTYTWYCTKVVWSLFNKYGVDIDSNSLKVDFTQSGLYSLVKTYYNTLYFYSSSKATAAINAYITDARSKIVLAEEIMLSPKLTKVYEKIRE